MVLDGLPAIIKTEVAHALETKRETGLIAVQADEELELAVERSEELQRVDAEEFARLTGQKVTGALNTFRFLKTEFDLQTRVTTTQPQIEAMVRNQVRVGPEQVSLSAIIDYTIKRAGVFTLQALLPEGYRVEAVTGNNILQWTEGGLLVKGPSSGGAEEAATRNVLEIRFKERTLGTYPLRIELTRSLKELPSNVGIPGVHPLGTRKLTGYVSVMAEPGVAIKLASSDGLTEIPANAIPGDSAHGGGSVLGYKFIVSDSGTTAPWKLSVGTEAVESWIRAEIVNTLTLTDSLLTGKAVAQYEIQNAPVKELRFRIPAEFRNVEISGQNIRRRDHEGGSWKVEFQNKVRGLQTLSVTWDQPRPGPTNLLDITGVSADGVERETGIVAIIARAPWQVTERSAKDLKPIDVRDLPEWAGRPDDATVLAYRYVRPGYNLSLEPKRFEEAEVLQALVENVNLTTVVADDGQMMTQISLSVRNQGRQHLEVTLPAGATVWSAFVAGQAVRPSVREDKLLLPLEHSNGDDTPIAIELTYVGATPFPQHRGAVELISPRLDVPLKSARWELFLPPDYQYRDFGGTMTREIASAASETSSFSWLDYNQRESRNKVEMAKEFKSDLSNAQQKLSSGNVKEALTDYNRARSKGNYAQNGDADAKKLEANLRRAQGSNLINAQNAFINNGFQLAEQRLEPGSQTRQVQYDETAAEAQWAKLQQAQELGLAKVQPIRVSLPTRGLRHGFTQVLQAEAGKPMTIRLMAANEKVVSWPGRVAAGLGGFLLLWIIIAVLTRKGPARGLTTAPA
jgi:hypothetical protein